MAPESHVSLAVVAPPVVVVAKQCTPHRSSSNSSSSSVLTLSALNEVGSTSEPAAIIKPAAEACDVVVVELVLLLLRVRRNGRQSEVKLH